MTSRRRGEMLSALRTVGRAVGRPLDAIPAEPRALADLMGRVSPLRKAFRRGAGPMFGR